MAKAAKVCIAEVEELVEPGEIKPEQVHLSGAFVHRLVRGEVNYKRVAAVNEKETETTGYMVCRHRKYLHFITVTHWMLIDVDCTVPISLVSALHTFHI
jgi:Coenzyme A transferase